MNPNKFHRASSLLLTLFVTGLVLQTMAVSVRQLRLFGIVHREAVTLSLPEKVLLADRIIRLAHQYDVDPLLVAAVMHIESRFDPRAKSNRGALGLMQVKPIVVKDVADQLGVSKHESPRLLSDMYFNVRVGIHYLAKLLDRFDGDIPKALMAYNAGPTYVSRHFKRRTVPLKGYQALVLQVYSRYEG